MNLWASKIAINSKTRQPNDDDNADDKTDFDLLFKI